VKCFKCQDNFEEKEIQESHDIPKYIGGTDLDGRHNLCKDCHNKYELQILISCLHKLGIDIDIIKSPKYYMGFIKSLDNHSKKICVEVAKKQMVVFYG